MGNNRTLKLNVLQYFTHGEIDLGRSSPTQEKF